ncbi:MAG: acyltransferase, partial [Chitinophagaceae bacterium]
MFIQLKHTLTKEEPARTPAAVSATRLQWVDHARGLAIIMVVYRHVIVGMQRSSLPVTELMYSLQEVVYNFRMPVFFILSGIFLTASLKKKDSLSVGKDRAATILYPYLVWGTITILLQILFSGYANAKREWSDLLNLFLDPRGVDHLWYLLALFNTNVLY